MTNLDMFHNSSADVIADWLSGFTIDILTINGIKNPELSETFKDDVLKWLNSEAIIKETTNET